MAQHVITSDTSRRRHGRRGVLRRIVVALLAALTGLTLVPSTATAQDQVLTWTAGNSVTAYLSAPETAVAGTALVIFDNSVAAGNTTGMPHTLTFDTSSPGYNHDVDLNITANPFDGNGGYYEAEITLTPGTYRYFCAIPGHGAMWGELIVTDGGEPDPEDSTPPEVSAQVAGEQDEDGNYLGSATVTIDATDDDSGVESVEYSLNGGDFTAYSEPVVVSEVGEHTVDYRAADVAGNSAEGSVTFTVVEEDEPEPGECTDTRATVVIDGNDTGVANAEVDGGCTINDLIDEGGEYAGHGAFVRHVGAVVLDLAADGVVTQREAGLIARAAAASGIAR